MSAAMTRAVNAAYFPMAETGSRASEASISTRRVHPSLGMHMDAPATSTPL